jgi:hypothetical protein
MFPKINQLIVNLLLNFDSIPEDRKLVLNDLASKIRTELKSKELLNLLFVCTHNSRRSHMGQIWGTIAARYFDLPLFSFSAGTEITALHPNVIQMLINEGFEVKSLKDEMNPEINISYGSEDSIACFSKLIDDAHNPKDNFYALMMCTDAEANCPFVPGAISRVGIPFNDPKAFDGTSQVMKAYSSTMMEIGIQILYLFKQIKNDEK